jgi:uncharacterized cofD-like protein
MRNTSAEKWPRPLRWLLPGLGVKRWYALIILGLAVLSGGVLLFFNLSAMDLVALVHPENEWWAGAVGILLGLLAVSVGVRGILRSVARAFLPAEEGRLVDVMLRCRNRGDARVVAIGGGTGLASLLRGLKLHSDNLAAIVTVSDDGGSSGRLREELGLLAAGDVRNCLVALADSEPLMTQLFNYRFDRGAGDLSGHSFGNLLIAALTSISGDFVQALRDSSHILAIHGEVLPPSVQPVTLCARLKNGETVRGETAVAQSHGQVEYAYLDPPAPRALPEAVEALEQAEAVVVGPGSVYTSIIPNLLVPRIAQTLAELQVPRIYVCNVMTQPGETDNFTAVDHVQAILSHVEEPIFDYVLLNTRRPSAEVLARYEAEGAHLVEADERGIARLGLVPVGRDLIAEGSWARHDPIKLAKAVIELVAEHR